MDDLVDRIGCRRTIRMIAIMRRQFFGDLVEPFIKHRLWPRVERGEGTNDPRLALGNDEFGAGNDEKGRANNWQTQAIKKG